MKILVVVSGPAQGSGVRSAAEAFGRAMEDSGHQIEVCPIDVRTRTSGNRVNLENLTGVLSDACRVVRTVRRSRPDTVWFHTLGFPLLPALRSLVVVAAVRLAGGRAVAHLHAYGLNEASLGRDRPSGAVLRMVGWLAARVVVLHEAAAQAVGGVVSSRKVVVMPNVVDVPDQPAPLPLGPRLRLVFVGGLVRRKGVPELLEAMRLVDDDLELHLVGGPGEDGVVATRELIRSAADLVDAGRVVFEGELDDAGVRAQLRAADLFVLPSRSEGTPIALLEAMAEGRPVIASDAGDMGEIVRRAAAGWVVIGHRPADIAIAIERAVRARSELAQRGASASQAVRAGHSRTTVRALLDSVAEPPGRHRGIRCRVRPPEPR